MNPEKLHPAPTKSDLTSSFSVWLTIGAHPRPLAITSAAVGCSDWYGLLPVRSRHHVPW